MIKRLLGLSLIICVTMCFFGCDGETTEPVTTTGESDIVSNDKIGSDGEEITSSQQDKEFVAEPTTKRDTDNSLVSTEDWYEKFEDYTIKKMYLTMRVSAGINVRKGPSENYDRADGAKKDQIVNVIGQCVETGWYMVKINGVVGFASNQFLTVSEDSNKVVLGDECPYKMYTRTEYNGQMGWFYRTELGWQPLEYNNILDNLTQLGYTIENYPIYIGTWRDVGDVMWIGYSKK